MSLNFKPSTIFTLIVVLDVLVTTHVFRKIFYSDECRKETLCQVPCSTEHYTPKIHSINKKNYISEPS